jgi:hypothetical protein
MLRKNTISAHTFSDGLQSILTMETEFQALAGCTSLVQSLMLAIGGEVHLPSEGWRDPSRIDYTAYAGLVDANGSDLSSRTVTLDVNGTAYPLTTNDTGYVSPYLALQPGDTSANMYQVMATFNGTNPGTASLNASEHKNMDRRSRNRHGFSVRCDIYSPLSREDLNE